MDLWGPWATLGPWAQGERLGKKANGVPQENLGLWVLLDLLGKAMEWTWQL